MLSFPPPIESRAGSGREPRTINAFWIPAYAGMTFNQRFPSALLVPSGALRAPTGAVLAQVAPCFPHDPTVARNPKSVNPDFAVGEVSLLANRRLAGQRPLSNRIETLWRRVQRETHTGLEELT
jgi:hypothetical protein